MDINHIDYLIKQLEALKTAETIVYTKAVQKKKVYTREAKKYHDLTPEQREKVKKRAREYNQNLPEEKRKEKAEKLRLRYETDEAYRNNIIKRAKERREVEKEERRILKLQKEAENKVSV